MSFKIGTSDIVYQHTVGDNGQHNSMNIGDTAIAKPNATTIVHRAFNAMGQVIESTGDILSAPGRWVKSMQENWFGYMIVVAIILVALIFLYCALQYTLRRKNNSSTTKNIVELVAVLLGQKLPMTKSNPSITSNSSTISTAANPNMTV